MNGQKLAQARFGSISLAIWNNEQGISAQIQRGIAPTGKRKKWTNETVSVFSSVECDFIVDMLTGEPHGHKTLDTGTAVIAVLLTDNGAVIGKKVAESGKEYKVNLVTDAQIRFMVSVLNKASQVLERKGSQDGIATLDELIAQ